MTGSETTARFRAARRDPGLTVLEGLHAVKHALRFGAVITELVSPEPAAVVALAERLAADVAPEIGRRCHEVPPGVFTSLAPTAPNTGLLAIAERPALDLEAVLEADGAAPAVLLERATHLGNLGAAVRVAAAAGAAGVLALGGPDPWHPAGLRGSAGLHFALPVVGVAELPPSSRPLVAFHPDGEPFVPAELPARALLAFGSERTGLSRELLARADRILEIPMQAGVSSLNLATAAAVALYGWRLGGASSAADSSPQPD